MWAEILPKNFDANLTIFFKIRKFYTFLGIKFLDVIGSDIFPTESKNTSKQGCKMGSKSDCVICEIATLLSKPNCVICEIAKIANSQIAKVAKIANRNLCFLRKLRIFIL